MENIIKDIQENCKDKSIKGIIKFLYVSGDLTVTGEAYREIWHFYLESIEMLKSSQKARALTKKVMKINESKFKRIQTRYKNRPLD